MIFIKSVLQAIPNYVMSVFLLPQTLTMLLNQFVVNNGGESLS